MIKILLRVPEPMNDDLEILMQESGENKNVLIRRILREYIDQVAEERR